MGFTFKNVNNAFTGLVYGIYTGEIPTVKEESRAGNVLRIPEPVTVCYENPLERVLFNPARDANPFFHMFESLWMLAGRNDVEPLRYFNSKIGEIASDDLKTFNGAYGYRWRKGCNQLFSSDNTYGNARNDQLKILIDHLKRNPGSRRAVLQMWNVEDDLLKIDKTKDVCCNTAAYFSISNGSLDMTVTNRSNDLIWGMLGANVVHFSFLQEYMANCIGVGVGKYYQFTNNLHAYENNWKPDTWLAENNRTMLSDPRLGYGEKVKGGDTPLVQVQDRFDQEVKQFIDDWDYPHYQETFIHSVAKPMVLAYRSHKIRDYRAALIFCDRILASDWKLATTDWITRRKLSWEKRNAHASADQG